jgi:hypothetical protein
MRPRVFSLVAALLLMVMLPTTALAVRPDRQPSPLPPELDLPAGAVCSFAVHVEFVVNRGTVTSFFDANGDLVKVLSTGALFVRLSAADDSESAITLNISGPTRQVFHADGSSTLTFAGRSISLFPPGTLILTAGKSVVELDAEGNFVSVTNFGLAGDVCDMIAA